MFAYCGNNYCNKMDSSGCLYIVNHPISDLVENGFNVSMSEDFLDPAVCLYYSYELVDKQGDGSKLCGMTAERIALEINSHAWLYYFGVREKQNVQQQIEQYIVPSLEELTLIPVADYLIRHGDPITVNNDESKGRMIVYRAIWATNMSGVNKASVRTRYRLTTSDARPHPKGGPNKDALY